VEVQTALLEKGLVSWGDTLPPGTPAGFRFVERSGAGRLPVSLVAEPVHSVLTGAVKALRLSLPENKRLLLLEKRLADLVAAEHQPRRLAILAGLGEDTKQWTRRWNSLQQALAKEFAGTKATLAHLFGGDARNALVVQGSCEGALMFGAASPTLRDRDVFNLASRLVRHSTSAAAQDKLAGHATYRPPNPRASLPGQEGYQLAQEWAKSSHLDNPTQPVDIGAHLHAFGVTVDELAIEDEQIGGVAIAREKRNPPNSLEQP